MSTWPSCCPAPAVSCSAATSVVAAPLLKARNGFWMLDARRQITKKCLTSRLKPLNKATPEPPAAAAARSKNSPRIIMLLQLPAAAAYWLLSRGCWLLAAAACLLAAGYWLLLAAGCFCWLLQKRRSRTGKHHGSEGQMGQKKMTKNCLTSRLKLL